jgi:UDP-N-acetyl-D-glucosamine dehydrogenase
VNIALVNELKLMCQRMNIDVWEVIDAAATKPFGFMPFYPGPGLGGHCIPIDPFYLTWKAREYDFATRFIELAGEINTQMPYHVVNGLMHLLNDRGRAMNGSKILVLGVAYKKNVDDDRESPSLKIIELLKEEGAVVDYNDPFIPVMKKTRHFDHGMTSVELTADRLAEHDAVLVLTDHDAYDWDFVCKHARLVVDTRNATKRVTTRDNIRKL